MMGRYEVSESDQKFRDDKRECPGIGGESGGLFIGHGDSFDVYNNSRLLSEGAAPMFLLSFCLPVLGYSLLGHG